jgi:hypothetical protein
MVLKNLKTLLATLFVLAGLSGQATAAGATGVNPDLLAVAQNYFDALQAGDRDTLLSLFGDKERARNEARLSDPSYSQFLRDRYRTARLEVLDDGMISGVSYVDIAIWLNDNEAVRERLIIEPAAAGSQLVIAGRKELE